MDIKVTYYPLKMKDGRFHIMKKTQVFPSIKIEEDKDTEPFDDYLLANEMANILNGIGGVNVDLSD